MPARNTTLLRALVKDEVSLKNFPAILQTIAEHAVQNEKGPRVTPSLLAEIRIALARTISASVADEEWRLSARVLETGLDHLLARAAASDSPIRPEIAEELEAEVEGALGSGATPLVLLCTRFARAELANLCANFDERVRVVAVEELCDDIKLKVTGTLALAGLSAAAAPGAAEASPS